jgi:hypothetical protein
MLNKLPPITRAWPIYLVAVLVVGATYYWRTYRPSIFTKDSILPEPVKLEQNIDVRFSDVVMQGRQKGVQRWAVTADRVILSRDGRYTYFEPNPKGKVFNLKDWNTPESESPNPTASTGSKVKSMNWVAQKATFDQQENRLVLTKKVVLTTEDQDIMKTDELIYETEKKKLRFPKKTVLYKKDGTILKGDKMDVDVGSEVLEVSGNVDLLTNANGDSALTP